MYPNGSESSYLASLRLALRDLEGRRPLSPREQGNAGAVHPRGRERGASG